MSTPFGAQTAWRQLVDLIGRGRAPASDRAITRLRSIRPQVPAAIRAASGRALAFARPPAPLVRLFAEEDLTIAAPVLRMAALSEDEWIAMLPVMTPAGRSVLRHRRDLPAPVLRALEAYGPTDFILPAADVTPADVTYADAVADAAPASADAADPVDQQPVVVASIDDSTVPVAASAVLPSAEPQLEPSVLLADEGTSVADPANADVSSAVAGTIPVDWTQCTTDGATDDLTVIDAAPPAPVPPVAVAEPELESDLEAAQDPEPEPEPEPEQLAAPLSIDWTEVISARPAPMPDVPKPAEQPARTLPTLDGLPAEEPSLAPAPSTDWSFVSIASVAFGLPVVVEALRHQGNADESVVDAEILPEAVAPPETAAVALEGSSPPASDDMAVPPPPAQSLVANDIDPAAPRGPYQISDLVARIDAFQKQREEGIGPGGTPLLANAVVQVERAPEVFQFEADAEGVIRWVAGVSRAALIGISLDINGRHSGAQVDGVASGAFRRRAGFANARLVIEGESDAAGQWRMSGVPVFDRQTGRFTGYRGSARRPRPDERAEPEHAGRTPATDSLRQLVHELRTPTTAIAGFAEMIEGELLGPVPPAYRDYAGTIRSQAVGLLGAIDDLDMAARIEAQALELRPVEIPVAALLERISRDLAPLATLRGATVELAGLDGTEIVRGDDRAVDRLLSRLLAAVMSATSPGEAMTIRAASEGDETVAVHINRPRALAAYSSDSLLAIDAETEAEADGAPLLGTGFALRLARNLAAELGGSLTISADRLTLRLPAAFSHDMGHASTI